MLIIPARRTFASRLSRIFNKYSIAGVVMLAIVTVPAIVVAGPAVAPSANLMPVAPPADPVDIGIPAPIGTPVVINPGTGPVTPPMPTPTKPLLFGIGPELDSASRERLTAEAPIKMLTSWYNGSNDLGFMTGWKRDLIPQAYAKGDSLHLVIYSDDPEQAITTKYGAACGRPYPLSSGFLGDMQQLAQAYNGSGQLYVSMFTELQTYPCQDNQWKGAENYYKALKDQYRATQAIFKQYAPNAKLSLSWGGWQANYDDVANGGGSSLITQFADVLRTSDFQSFQAMGTQGDNKDIMLRMTKALHQYGPVMVSHFKPDNASQTAFDADMRAIFTPATIKTLQDNGLFSISFMDSKLMQQDSSYAAVKSAVTRFGQ